MSTILSRFDPWLDNDGPAALVIREHLMPVEGTDGVLFPPTFAASEDRTFKGGYNIDDFGDGTNCCLIDSIGSQANRIEPLFAREKYTGLVPQITIKAGEIIVNLLEAGHRAGDAIVRCTALQAELQAAFKEAKRGNAEPLAKIAPTSLVFGVWDSRDTQAKLPRLIASTIRAFDVKPLTRSSQFIPTLDYTELEVFGEEDKAKAEGDSKNPLAKRGFVHHPASGSHGGVIAAGGVRRDATLSIAALRLLNAGPDKDKSERLRRYILGLSLVAFTYRQASYLRQGCNLVPDTDKPAEFVEVHSDGSRHPATITHDEAIAYATAAADEFGIGNAQEVQFDKDLAKKDVQAAAECAAKPARVKKAKAK